MFTIFQGSEESIRVDGRVPKSLPRLKDVPCYASIAKSVHGGRRIVFILGGDPACCELNIDKRGSKKAEASILH